MTAGKELMDKVREYRKEQISAIPEAVKAIVSLCEHFAIRGESEMPWPGNFIRIPELVSALEREDIRLVRGSIVVMNGSPVGRSGDQYFLSWENA